MKRLVIFGCSHAYGSGLKDFKLHWSSLVANELGIELINKAKPGDSIKGSVFNICNFSFKPDDLVIVMWTSLYRHCVIKQNTFKYTHLLPSVEKYFENAKTNTEHEKLNKLWYKYFFNPIEAKFNAHINIKFVDYYLKEKNIKLLHTFATTRLDNLELINPEISMLFYSDLKHYPKASDGMHNGPEANEIFSKIILQKIGEKFGI